MLKSFPFSNLQIRFNSDNTVEVSGLVDIQKVIPYAKVLGYSADDIKSALDTYHLPQIKLPFYLKGKGSIEKDHLDFSFYNLETGKLPVPQAIVVQNTPKAIQLTEDLLSKVPGLSVKTMKVDNGNLVFSGTLPQKITKVMEK